MQKGDAPYPVGLAALRTCRLMPAALRSGAMITTSAAPAARAFRGQRTVIVARCVRARRRPAGAVLRAGCGRLARGLAATL
ncbi:hypothetical protein ABTN08_19750, partial [Acinetobacter baumannii]